ncbi:hypothetical protein OROMI_000851 [Orobanche minor]
MKTIPHKATIGQYLGINNMVCWKDHMNSQDIILKTQKKLAGWKTNSISRGGRLALLKANLSVRVAFSAAHMFNSYIANKFDRSSSNYNNSRIVWKSPDRNLIKVNFDGSAVSASNLATSGCILRNEDGNAILASSKKIGFSSVIRAEAFALKAAVLHGHINLIVEGDSKVLIDIINGLCSVP